MSTKHAPTPWLRDGRLIYSLEPSGYRKGKEVFENRFSTYVEAGRNTTLAEAESTAEFIQRACNCHDELVAALTDLFQIALFFGPERGHSGPCGPEAGCDAICQDVATLSDILGRAKRIIDKVQVKE